MAPDISDEQNVWACLMTYRYDKAVQLQGIYGTSSAIIKKLGNYPLRGSYHGHRSGGGGDGTNPGADKNLDAAISFLEKNKPAVSESPSAKKGVNTALKNASLQKTEALLTIIREEDNLGVLVGKLDNENKDWRDIKTVRQSYVVKYRAKKGKDPSK